MDYLEPSSCRPILVSSLFILLRPSRPAEDAQTSSPSLSRKTAMPRQRRFTPFAHRPLYGQPPLVMDVTRCPSHGHFSIRLHYGRGSGSAWMSSGRINTSPCRMPGCRSSTLSAFIARRAAECCTRSSLYECKRNTNSTVAEIASHVLRWSTCSIECSRNYKTCFSPSIVHQFTLMSDWTVTIQRLWTKLERF